MTDKTVFSSHFQLNGHVTTVHSLQLVVFEMVCKSMVFNWHVLQREILFRKIL